MAAEWLEQFESLDVIGNGSFGVIRKVRRKADGAVFARKDLNFSLMSERDKRQIVAEVNILKDLHHEHIVRYYDRMVDRDSGILYILMEYCGGGDLSALVKRSAREADRAGLPPRGLDEDKVWNILMQLLKALVYCHHPNAAGNASSSSSHSSGHHRTPSAGSDGETKRPQILHRDIKPDNVFLDEQDNIKLGDFGLSKALLDQASFANTYVGTPYYMSPELMQEKAYDNKSDIWSLGCLVYELCALKPPFHEARTHAELATFIKNGRIPPLPRGYSSTLSSTIKAMLNLNPAMRPSAIQLMQHERIDYVIKIDEVTKAIANVKAHKEQVIQRERNILSREQALSQLEAQREADVGTLQITLSHTQEQLALAQAQIVGLQAALHEARSPPSSPSPAELSVALAARDAEHAERAAARDAEVAAAWDAREAELLQAVRARELELEAAWSAREKTILADVTAAVEAKVRVMAEREKEIADAWERREEEIRERWEEMEAELQVRVKAREAEVQVAWEEREARMEQEANERLKLAVQRVWDELRRTPSLADESFEEWHSIADVSTSTDGTDAANTTVTTNDTTYEDTPKTNSYSALTAAMFKTPINTATGRLASRFLKTPLPALTKSLLEATSPPTHADLPSPAPISELAVSASIPGSAMRGVVLTSTGQPLATPAPAEFLKLFARPLSPKKLDFGQAKKEADEVEAALTREDGYDDATPRPLEKRASLANAPALRVKLSKDKVEAPVMRRARTSVTSVTSVLGPSSPRKLNQRPISPAKERASRASSEIKRAPSSASDVKKSERPLTRTFTAPAIGAGAGARTGRASLSGAPKKSRESLSAASSKTQAQPDTPVLSSSSSSVQRSGLSASDSSATSTEPDTTDTALPPVKEKTTSRKLARAVNGASSAPAEAPKYDLDDEENLPSPFLKRVDRVRFVTASGSGTGSTASSRAKAAAASTAAPQPAPTTAITRTKSGSVSAAGRRLSQANLLRVVAAKNATRAPSPGRSSEAPAAASKRPAPNNQP